MGGSSDPSVPRSPGVSPQKLQGGPWAPPPCRVKSSENCQVFACGSFSGTFGIFVGFSVRCSSLGKVYCLVLCPLRPDPCMPRCWLSPLSFFCVRYARRRRFSLFLSFSGAGETQTPFGVWDSPCVSPTWPRTTSSIRTPCSPSSPRFRTRSCVCVFFFSFVAVVVRCYGCGWLRSVWFLFVWGCFSGLGSRCSVFACTYL